LATIWTALDTRRRWIAGLAALATFAIVIYLASAANRTEQALLYAGLEPSLSGEVLAQLDAQNIAYTVQGSNIYVDAAVRDQTRLSLAAQGLPATGSSGYELLDQLTGFGTTARMFDATYLRAKEGELARTIVSAPDVRSARVHIAAADRPTFGEAQPPTASVTVTMGQGALAAHRAEALRYLVSSAVVGMSPNNVTVIDTNQGVVLAAGDAPSALTQTSSDIDARAEALKGRLERLLEARVGTGRAVVEVMIEANLDHQTITERVLDPTSRVAISTDTEERSEAEQGQSGGAVTVASNLPDGDAGEGSENRSQNAELTRERVNFEVSETRRELVVTPGQVQRISVAVIVDGLHTISDAGERVWQPRPEAEMEALRSLVQSAVGFDAARGDVVTLESLEFPTPAPQGIAIDTPSGSITAPLLALLPYGLLSLVAIVLGLFVVRPILTQQPAPEPIVPQANDILPPVEPPEPQPSAPPEPPVLEPPEPGKIANLRTVIDARTEESGEVLRRWIEAPEPTPEVIIEKG
ncbi:MAG: flagellar basal-body MS-ring/collar protein FliF, partial [Pseudomonadota bacterium]